MERPAAALLAVWANQIAHVSLTATEIPFVLVLPGELERDLLAGRLARQYILQHPWETLARFPAR